ncbi:MAG: IS1380 family transposase [Candidatus Dormibacteria bacterium]
MSRVSRVLDRLGVTFDDEGLVANAGLLLVATLAQRLGIEALVSSTLGMAGRVGGADPGRKVMTLVHAIVAGGSHIDHAEVLRAGDSARVLGHRVMAPSTLGTFLRSFSFGHVRQLEAVTGKVLERAWAKGAGPGDARLVVDIDSTVCEVEGKKKQGAAYGYTKVLGYHPILASRAGTGEIIAARMRKGSANTARGARRFIDEVVARARRAGASGEVVMRFDSGFWAKDTITTLARHGVGYTMAVRTNTKGIAQAIAGIDEAGWAEIAYTPDGRAQVAETEYWGKRLIVRRTRLTGARQAALWPDWRHFGFLTDLDGSPVDLDAFHRAHATVELAIRDLKEGAGLEHCPSGNFSANSAWLQCAVLAHNLVRWAATIGEAGATDKLTVARTVRFQLLSMPARLVNRSGTHVLRAPARWPWADLFTRRLDAIRALPAPT